MYDFNIIVEEGEIKEKFSFTIDEDDGIYKMEGVRNSRNYFLTWEECNLINKFGGIDEIKKFLIATKYRDILKVENLKLINCNP